MIALYARALALAGAILLAAPASLAQAPKVGQSYERAELGFKIKTPADWDLIPPQPGDPHLLAKFDPPIVKYVITGSGPGDRVFLQFFLLKFDRRKVEGDEKSGARRGPKPLKNVQEWIQKGGEVENGGTLKADGEKEFSVRKIPAVEYQFTTPGDEKTSQRVYAAQFQLSPDLDIAMVGTGPGSRSKWSKYENVYQQMAKSFMAVEVAAGPEKLGADAPIRDRERVRLQGIVDALGKGWQMYETPNYFVVSPHTDKAFIDELCGRLEAIRAIYEVDYPADKAKELREAGEAARTGDEDPRKKAEREAEKRAMKAIFGDADPRELSRCSVVRVFNDQGQYHSYGGPPGSAGYWSAAARELVIYDDQAGGGRNDTWIVLNHEAFHQYIFYLYGNISPHSWYNEGTGDFYSGYEYKMRRFTLKTNLWRRDTIKEAVRKNEHIPLKDFVRLTQAEYYGQNKWNVGGGQNYAQGWSLIYFLRTGKKSNAKGWNDAWDGILDNYFRVLALSGDLDQAVTEAFLGIDFDELEAAWKDFVK